MHRHDLPERAARHVSAWADPFDQIKPAWLRLGRSLGAYPAQDLFRIGQERENGGGWSFDLNLTSDNERFVHPMSPEARACQVLIWFSNAHRPERHRRAIPIRPKAEIRWAVRAF